ncbi:phage terminase small subunit P27 family [Liquorilactobacillus capillatus]|uniref:Phage terminase, small subunit, P27 family n=1 Tax=Liquorilactobacillus capillatus DSM 19910 TaxID=1423731 RepID=A0A0R1MBM0_9LACO|nr:phage terminase small subunit P27 family [Liquorilactobacillus capillatus]KRL02514.1 phage terminase, small subunit, P27 family [Liquorilactobacillus capillatus DSM 19910]
MVKNVYYKQNGGHLSKDPPKQLSALAKECWRKVVPFLESTGKVQRIDSSLVELYCSQYGIYRKAYESVKKDGIQTKTFKPLQDMTGKVIGKYFTGYKKNPALATMKDSINMMSSIGSELGLSPKSRAELLKLVKSQNKKSVTDGMREFFGGSHEEN